MTNVLTALLLVLVAEASSAQPINIEAARFEMLLAERKAVYTGDVYAIQGDHAINADKLVAMCPVMKVLFASGYALDVIAHHGVLKEGVQFIAKPYSLDTLASRMCEALGDK